jgi:uncharacterized protein
MTIQSEQQKIQYLDGKRFRVAFLAGADAVIADQAYLNKINVFPVPDSDTGTNLTSTVQAISAEIPNDSDLDKVLKGASEAALTGSRGNSGIILSQFIYGLSKSFKGKEKVNIHEFAHAVNESIHHVYTSLMNPVEGTIISVMKKWGEALTHEIHKSDDFVEVLRHSYDAALEALKNTPNQLKVLKDANVVDSGAKGFVDILEGMQSFIQNGNLRNVSHYDLPTPQVGSHEFLKGDDIKYRYCTEALLENCSIDFIELKNNAKQYGDSVVVAGSPERLRLHMHTNEPALLFEYLQEKATLRQIKADDMLRQYQASHEAKYKIALVTDSAGDLPPEFINEHQIHVIPVNIIFGDNNYLDKITMTAKQFYQMMDNAPMHPTTSQASLANVKNLFAFLSTHYETVISVHLAGKLSGMYQQAKIASEEFDNVHVIDSFNISASQALVVCKIQQQILDGKSVEDIIATVEALKANSHLFVDVVTMKYLVRSGRVSPMKGRVANLLNLKPIISLADDGSVKSSGASVTRNGNQKKILDRIAKLSQEKKLWNYAIVHGEAVDRAEEYASKLTQLTGRPPLFIEDISPALGVHNGRGVIGVGIMFDEN